MRAGVPQPPKGWDGLLSGRWVESPNWESWKGDWVMGDRKLKWGRKVGVQDHKDWGTASLWKLVWKPSLLWGNEREQPRLLLIWSWFALQYWWGWDCLDADTGIEFGIQTFINNQHLWRKGRQSKMSQKWAAVQPRKAASKPWTKYCSSERFHVWPKGQDFYTPALISHWM